MTRTELKEFKKLQHENAQKNGGKRGKVIPNTMRKALIAEGEKRDAVKSFYND